MNEGIIAAISAAITGLIAYLATNKKSDSSVESTYVENMDKLLLGYQNQLDEYRKATEALKVEVARLEERNDQLEKEVNALKKENDKLKGGK